MWMLYGGAGGQGAMLDLRQRDMNRIIKAEYVELGTIDSNQLFRTSVSLDIEQAPFELYCIDILYEGKDEGEYSYSKGNESIGHSNSPCPAGFFMKKAAPWSYENETRLVLEVPEAAVPDNVEFARIQLPVPENCLIAQTYLAPNSKDKAGGFNLSSLKGSIEWDFGRVEKRQFHYLKAESTLKEFSMEEG